MQTAAKTGRRPATQMLSRKVHEGHLERIARYAAYIYIGLPIVIFMLGWIRPYIGIPLALAVLIAFIQCFRGVARTPVDSGRAVSKSTLLGMLLLICAWVYLSGIGGYVFQNTDHYYRNEMFKILVDQAWPPVKKLATSTGYQTVFFSYYIGFWLPAALFGKVFGLECGYAFQYLWSVIGLCIIFVLLSKKIKKWCISTVLIFALFSGLDILGCLFTGADIFSMSMQEHIEWWSGYQFSSHTTQLFWVFNQAIYGWLLTALLLNEEDNRRVVLIWSCGLLECTFPFVGMLPFLACKIIENIRKTKATPKDFLRWTNGLFSIENILGGGVTGIVSFLYLFGNNASLSSGTGLLQTRPADLFVLLLFILLEAGVFFIAIFPYQRKNPLFWIALATLALCPAVRIGGSQDFCMRVSIPSLMVLCVLVIETLHIVRRKNHPRYFAILALLLVGAITPMHEIIRTSIGTFSAHVNGANTINYVDEDDVFSGVNFTSSVDSSLFAKYFTDLKETWFYGRLDASGGMVGELTGDQLVEQRFIMSEDATISTVIASFGTYARTNDCKLSIVMVDDTGKATPVGLVDCSNLEDNATRAIDILPYPIQKDRWYSVQFIPSGASPGNAVTIFHSTGKGDDWRYAMIDGEEQDFDLAVAFAEREETNDEGNSSGRRLRNALQRGIPVQAEADD